MTYYLQLIQMTWTLSVLISVRNLFLSVSHAIVPGTTLLPVPRSILPHHILVISLTGSKAEPEFLNDGQFRIGHLLLHLLYSLCLYF